MPRNKSLLKGGSGGRSKKIVIRPYQKPPALPPQYYDTTVQELLRVTRAVLQTTTTSTSTSSSTMSLQNAYTAVVALVSHQLGPRLYKDLKVSLEEACATVLTPETIHASTSNNALLLQTIPPLYQQFTDYLLCVKHVFLPLDRTHVWQADTQEVLPIKQNQHQQQSQSQQQAHPNTSTNSTPGSSFPVHQSLWQVGLAVWANRLHELGLDTALYQAWMQALLQEWNSGTESTSTTTTTTLLSSSSTSPSFASEQHQHQPFALQSVWYMWQDLGCLGHLPLQHDLQTYWQRQSQTLQGDNNYRPVAVLQFCFHKHARVAQWATWLPAAWLQSIIEQVLFWPHLLLQPHKHTSEHTTSTTDSSNTNDDNTDALLAHEDRLLRESSLFPGSQDDDTGKTTRRSDKAAAPGPLLQPSHFHPLLEEALFGTTTMNSNNSSTTNTFNLSTPMAQLWMLAGRIPQGHAAVAKAMVQCHFQICRCGDRGRESARPCPAICSSNTKSCFNADFLKCVGKRVNATRRQTLVTKRCTVA